MQEINDSLDFTLNLTESNIKVTIKLKSSGKLIVGRIVGFRVYPKDHVTTWEFVDEQYIKLYHLAPSIENKKMHCVKIQLDDVEAISYDIAN